jgi:lipoprotein-anchoring transpeptidase ErfK/SrfK
MRRTGFIVSVLAAVILSFASAAQASILAKIDVSSQTMTVFVDGELTYTWLVSTARKGYHTPRGSFRPQWLDEMHFSSLYEDAPMPHSVFFNGDYAVHGSLAVRSLGRPASHGCVRLSPSHAAAFYSLIEDQGLKHAKIVIQD